MGLAVTADVWSMVATPFLLPYPIKLANWLGRATVGHTPYNGVSDSEHQEQCYLYGTFTMNFYKNINHLF